MKITDIKPNDVLVSTDEHGTGYYLVQKVNKVTVVVETEQGRVIRAYPHIFDRKAQTGHAVGDPVSVEDQRKYGVIR